MADSKDKGKKKKGSLSGPKGTHKVSTNPKKSYEFKKGEGWKETPKGEGTKKTTKVSVAKKKWFSEKGDVVGGKKEGKTENASGKIAGGFLYGEATATSELSFDLSKKEVKLNVIKAKVKGSAVHGEAEGEFDIGGFFGGLFSSDSKKKPAPPSTPGAPGAGPMAARVGDLTSHGTPLAPGIGSVNVLIGGMPAWRTMADMHLCPVVKGVVPDVGGPVLMGSPTVFINFMMACRVGDLVVEVPGGPNAIVMGCPTVLIGPSGTGGSSQTGGDESADDGPGLGIKGKADGDVLTAEAEAELAAVWDKDRKSAVAKVGAMAAVAKGSISGDLTIPIPFTEHAITLGAGAEGSVVSAGAEAEASAGWTKKDGFKAKAGLKAALGLGGGVNFSIGFK